MCLLKTEEREITGRLSVWRWCVDCRSMLIIVEGSISITELNWRGLKYRPTHFNWKRDEEGLGIVNAVVIFLK